MHTDHLNAPRKIAQPTTGTLTWRWDADPFGTAAPNQNPEGLGTFTYDLRFPGQYYMAETGLNQNWNRNYDPFGGGRYLESDPSGLRAGVNTYGYVNANTISSVDPTGLVEWTGTGTTFSFVSGIGATVTRYHLTSQCSHIGGLEGATKWQKLWYGKRRRGGHRLSSLG